jgi:hypothetical protein
MGAIFKVPGYIVYVLGGLWGLIICLGIVKAKLGFIGVIVGFVFFPVIVYLAPWYVGFADSNWQPLMVVYGSGIAAMILIGIGSAFDKK